jgi:hypothetical protein
MLSFRELEQGDKYIAIVKKFDFKLLLKFWPSNPWIRIRIRVGILIRIEANADAQHRAGIFKQSMGARNRVGRGTSYQPARLRRLAELIPWNQFLGSINV